VWIVPEAGLALTACTNHSARKVFATESGHRLDAARFQAGSITMPEKRVVLKGWSIRDGFVTA
jgi:hypothetical protein